MGAGIVGQRVGRRIPSQALNNARLPWGVAPAMGQRIMLVVTAHGADGYVKYANADDDISAVTVTASDCDDTLKAGIGFYMPVERGVTPVITGTVSAVEILGDFT